MSSEEIDSTTKQENGGAQFPANTTASISANSQKRKLSQDDSSSDDAKRLRANNGGANNAPASSNTDAAPQIVVGEQGPPAVSGSADPAAVVKVEIKEEPAEHAEEGTEVKTEPDEAAVKEEATSSVRDSCQYGIKCYRNDTTSPTPSKKQWTSKDIRKMLKMVEERPVIWQVDYSDRTSRPNAFLEIEKELAFPALEIKRKLHNMRCTFRNQFKNSQFLNRPVKWKYFDAMKFMYSSAFTSDGADPWDDDVPTKSSMQQKPDVPWKKRFRESHSNNSNKQMNVSKTITNVPSTPDVIENDKTEISNHNQDDCSAFGTYVADTIHNAETISMDSSASTLSVAPDSIYGMYPQAVSNETHEIQLGLHEF
ncbi:uncharacterized protein LOC119651142 isoform X3 [Hermetia illucens]|uniref:uncharacterized protein LOC119651142 isoform X3 n=1 Tax=Hermetia illucens TaxID=343691 RepID=UPI0018CC7BC0|nr:uncharacterized protein LOC119651142 isoform X3 [Hermetia illucens]